MISSRCINWKCFHQQKFNFECSAWYKCAQWWKENSISDNLPRRLIEPRAYRRYRGVAVRLQNARAPTGKGGQTLIESNFWFAPGAHLSTMKCNFFNSWWDTRIFIFHYICRESKRHTIRNALGKKFWSERELYWLYIFPNRRKSLMTDSNIYIYIDDVKLMDDVNNNLSSTLYIYIYTESIAIFIERDAWLLQTHVCIWAWWLAIV